MAAAVTRLQVVPFQRYSHRAKEDQKAHKPDTQQRSKRKMFHEDEERHEIKPSEAKTTRRAGREDAR